jgi:hypothetical protein
MSVANPLWEAPRSHGELLKLGVDVGQTTVATIVTLKVLLVPTKVVSSYKIRPSGSPGDFSRAGRSKAR